MSLTIEQRLQGLVSLFFKRVKTGLAVKNAHEAYGVDPAEFHYLLTKEELAALARGFRLLGRMEHHLGAEAMVPKCLEHDMEEVAYLLGERDTPPTAIERNHYQT